MSFDELSSADIATLRESGLAPEDALRQVEMLRHPPPPVRLLRPCTLDDGVVQLPEEDWAGLETTAAEEAESGAFAKFVPASGAATRMFGSLLRTRGETPSPGWTQIRQRAEAGDPAATDVVRLLENLKRFPFQEQLESAAAARGTDLSALRDNGEWHQILDLMLTGDGLGFADCPKALIPFHRADGAEHTAFAEQIDEGRRYLKDAAGRERYHFTVAPDALEDFERALAAVRAERNDAGDRLLVAFSQQSSSTNTLALSEAGELLRDASGAVATRPGGHGALLSNLQQTDAELAFIRNIDNILPRGELRDESIRWRRRLGGLLVTVRNRAATLLEDLQSPDASTACRLAAREFLAEWSWSAGGGPAAGIDADRHHLSAMLNRPIRVCGMVPNTGEPGGGPFWIATAAGTSMQIIERTQVDLTDDAQRRIWEASTHFNPVDLVCSLRDAHGEPYDLSRFADPDAVIVARKLVDGQPARVLERPGLWNGGMARWNTIFVEVPRRIFAPVKTIFDLLRPEHQPTEIAPLP